MVLDPASANDCFPWTINANLEPLRLLVLRAHVLALQQLLVPVLLTLIYLIAPLVLRTCAHRPAGAPQGVSASPLINHVGLLD